MLDNRAPRDGETMRYFQPGRIFIPTLFCMVTLLYSLPSLGADFGSPGRAMRVYWYNSRIIAEVLPLPNEGYIQIARRVMERPEEYASIVAFNHNRPVMSGRPVVFPLSALTPALRGQALRALYPEDELTEKGWAHRVTDPLESLIQLTEAYTGSKRYFKELARLNKLRNPDVLPMGTEIVVPLEWIPDEVGFRPIKVKPPLKLLKDPRTRRLYATYVLKPNETLYSLLIHFTDRERAEEINRMSGLLLKLNGLKHADKVPSGRPLRIPIEWISSDYVVNEFRPVVEMAPPTRPKPKRAFSLSGLHVILDAGHGGSDPGAVYGRRGSRDHVYEHEVVYDISLRLMDLLRARGYTVHPVVGDPKHPRPVDTLNIKSFGTEQVLVNPPYRMASSKVAVNMRVFLINAIFRQLTEKRRVPPENVILISIHGDALAPTLRGAMVYYPDHRLRMREFGPHGRVYNLRREAIPRLIRFDPDDNRQAQEASRDFAELIIRTFRSQGLGVSRRKPVRPYYYRAGERTLPAVLRYSRVPTSVLLEVANLNNRLDRLSLIRPKNRQRVARGLATAVEYYRNHHADQLVSRKAS